MNEDEPPDSREIENLTARIKFLESQLRCRERVLEVTHQTDRSQFETLDRLWALRENENIALVDVRARHKCGYNEEEYCFQVRLRGAFGEESVKRILAQNDFPEKPLKHDKNGEVAYVYRIHNIEVRFYQSTS